MQRAAFSILYFIFLINELKEFRKNVYALLKGSSWLTISARIVSGKHSIW